MGGLASRSGTKLGQQLGVGMGPRRTTLPPLLTVLYVQCAVNGEAFRRGKTLPPLRPPGPRGVLQRVIDNVDREEEEESYSSAAYTAIRK
jgi:hypothetical protein